MHTYTEPYGTAGITCTHTEPYGTAGITCTHTEPYGTAGNTCTHTEPYGTAGNTCTHTEPYGTAGKGKQMMVGGTKSKTAFQDGYFRKNFDRIMEVCDSQSVY